ncbi:MAG: tRNA pseudouridine(55) synthase TruB [Armatimonadota bacterium]|nr:tRNA pseudouridine(55) synthase TruB [Armatimonadota bacterium]
MDGVLNIDKPAGITSHDVVSRVRRILKIKRVGHAGTLDPMATGVLLVCIGHATRIAEYLVDAEKEYEGVITLGVTTDTQDSTGNILSEADASHITKEQLLSVLPEFTGRILQIPPMVSAAHHEGKRLYQLAREGKVVDRKPREVEVKQIELLDFQPTPVVSGNPFPETQTEQPSPSNRPNAIFRVTCSKGVYIRTLFADIGAALGVGAHMSRLRRTRIGRFVIDKSMNLDILAQAAVEGKAENLVITMAEALADMPEVIISPESLEAVRHGQAFHPPDDFVAGEGEITRIMLDSDLVALARVVKQDEGVVLQPAKVFI